MPHTPPSIGILGGLGPYAGLDLVQKLFDCCSAEQDQDHMPVMLYSFPAEIPPRVEFLLGTATENPGYAMGDVLVRLAAAGATVIGIPCNTAHSKVILDVALKRLYASGFSGQFVHMIEETIAYIRRAFPQAKRIGVLCTQGAYASGVFKNAFHAAGFETLFPDAKGREDVQNAISNREYGIKVMSTPVSAIARTHILEQAAELVRFKADILLLGCTELPLVLTNAVFEGVPVVDPTRILARSLVNAFDPQAAVKPE